MSDPESEAAKGPSMSVGRGKVDFNGKRMGGAYLCKIHEAALLFVKGQFTINGVTWKADPKKDRWIACCKDCHRELKDARGKRFACPVEAPAPKPKKAKQKAVAG